MQGRYSLDLSLDKLVISLPRPFSMPVRLSSPCFFLLSCLSLFLSFSFSVHLCRCSSLLLPLFASPSTSPNIFLLALSLFLVLLPPPLFSLYIHLSLFPFSRAFLTISSEVPAVPLPKAARQRIQEWLPWTSFSSR